MQNGQNREDSEVSTERFDALTPRSNTPMPRVDSPHSLPRSLPSRVIESDIRTRDTIPEITVISSRPPAHVITIPRYYSHWVVRGCAVFIIIALTWKIPFPDSFLTAVACLAFIFLGRKAGTN
jgi:hypothetical protein